jgi:hypothetical protein
MSTNLSGNSVTTDSITPKTSASTELSVTTTGAVNLSGQRINFNGATTGNFQHTGGTFKIQSIGQDIIVGNGSSQRVGIRTVSPEYTMDVNGTFSARERMHCYVSTAAASASVSTTNYVTFPSAGVYLLFISQCSGTTSSTPEMIDNLAKLFVVICPTLSSQAAQVVTLYNPSNGWFSISNISQLSIGLTVSAGSFTYQAFYQKFF